MKNNITMIVIGTAVVAGAVGFFGGMRYQQGRTLTRIVGDRPFGEGRPMMYGGGNGGGRMGMRPVAGEIISSDATSLTVKMGDGSSKIVILSEKTSINTASTASRSALTTGSQVAVFGTSNADGSVTAQSIQLTPKP